MRLRWPEHKRLRYPIVVALFALLTLQILASTSAFGDPAAQQPAASVTAEPAPATAPSIAISATTTPAAPAPALATHDVSSNPPPRRREFYESGWFWAAFGAAAFVGAVVFFAAQDSSPSAIHLHVEVPH